MNPENIDKYLYIKKTPTWMVRALYSFALVGWVLVLYGFAPAVIYDPFFRWFVGPILGIITIYHLLSFGISLCYKRFSIPKHEQLRDAFWLANSEPSVDIFLPICGESIDMLNNTWKHVSKLSYKNLNVYVLDDSVEDCAKHKMLAESYGFSYFERPNKGEMKKAGNLKYAYERTHGEFIVIFDADFAPRQDFLYELLPYTSDQTIGIVQSPQYFDTSKDVEQNSWLAYSAAYQEEFFYRIIQVAKDRLNAAICCGSNAIYRRAALDSIGGPRQVSASEDSRTGYALFAKGWITRYVPIILAVGVCPDNVYAYYHQQHRWCRGRSELVLSKEFLFAKVPLIVKLANVSGFMSFFLRPLEIILPFQLFWTLFFYNDLIPYGSSDVFYPYILFSFLILPIAHIITFRIEVFYVSFIQMYAAAHSVVSVFMGRTVGWISTNAKHSKISSAFITTTKILAAYVFSYVVLLALAIRLDLLHPLDYRYYSVQFWIFWNLTFAVIALFQFYRQIYRMRSEQAVEGLSTHRSLLIWKLRTAPLYLGLLSVAFIGIAFV